MKKFVSRSLVMAAVAGSAASFASADVSVFPTLAHAAHNFIPFSPGTAATPVNNSTMHQVFASTLFSNVSGGLPVTITELGFAPNLAGNYLSDVTIRMGYTNAVPGVGSASGGLAIPTAGGGGAPNANGAMTTFYSNPAHMATLSGSSTTNFELGFTGAFVYDPALGNLLVEIVSVCDLLTSADLAVSRSAGSAEASRSYSTTRFAPAESPTTATRMEFTYTVGTGPTGACCLPNGSCITSTAAGCSGAGGTYQGDGSQCGTVNCPQPPTGACCFFASCSVLSSFACAAQGGVYQGDGTACTGQCPQPSGSLVFALDLRATGTLIGFPLAAPAYNVLGLASSGFAMDFNGDGSTLYLINNPANQLGTVNTANGAFTPIATITGAGAGETNWGGLSFDSTTGTMYALAGTNLYTIDLNTANTTLVAPITGVAGALWIDIAIDGNGRMIAHDIATDVMAEINKTTGVATVLGPTGFAANFAQGMDFDPASGNLFATIYVGGGVGSFCQVNTTTGLCTVITNTQPWTGVGPEMEMAIRGEGGGGCYANCDGSTTVPFLNVNDFVCFQQSFAAGASYANCDGSTNIPVLNVNDFVCFQQAFAAGCSAP
jgi:hypothetical protein